LCKLNKKSFVVCGSNNDDNDEKFSRALQMKSQQGRKEERGRRRFARPNPLQSVNPSLSLLSFSLSLLESCHGNFLRFSSNFFALPTLFLTFLLQRRKKKMKKVNIKFEPF
jgi:hypothetical protein